VYIAIDSPKHASQFGGVIAAPIVGQIMEDSAPFIGFHYSKEQVQKEYRWGDRIERPVPLLIGEEKKNIMLIDEPFKIEWHGKGTKIVSQLPKAESLLSVDGTLHLYLGE